MIQTLRRNGLERIQHKDSLTMYALTNGKVFTGTDVLTNHAVIIDGDIIQSIVHESELPASIERIDLNGANLSPGFIDLQLNGCGGVMFNDEITAETIQIGGGQALGI